MVKLEVGQVWTEKISEKSVLSWVYVIKHITNETVFFLIYVNKDGESIENIIKKYGTNKVLDKVAISIVTSNFNKYCQLVKSLTAKNQFKTWLNS